MVGVILAVPLTVALAVPIEYFGSHMEALSPWRGVSAEGTATGYRDEVARLQARVADLEREVGSPIIGEPPTGAGLEQAHQQER